MSKITRVIHELGIVPIISIGVGDARPDLISDTFVFCLNRLELYFERIARPDWRLYFDFLEICVYLTGNGFKRARIVNITLYNGYAYDFANVIYKLR